MFRKCASVILASMLFVFITASLQTGTVDAVSFLKGKGPLTTAPLAAVSEVPGFTDDAGTGFCGTQWPFVATNGDTTISIILGNPGTADNHFSVAVNYFSTETGWINVNPASGIIPAGATNFPLAISLSDPPPGHNGVGFRAELVITHEASGSPRVIPLCLFIAYSDSWPTYANLSTACLRLRVFDNGFMADNIPGKSFDYFDDCDTFSTNTISSVYLYGGSPVITFLHASDTVRFAAFSSYPENGAFTPIQRIAVDSISNPSYTLGMAKFQTASPWFHIYGQAEYYVPRHPDSCEFIIQKYRFYGPNDTTYNGIVLGELLDWDIPSDSGTLNNSACDWSRKAIYQIGAEYNQDDSTEALCPQESNDRFGAIASDYRFFQNAVTKPYLTLVNPNYVQPLLPPGPTYRLMSQTLGCQAFTSSHPDSQYVDLATLVTFDEFQIRPRDTICIINILAVSKTGQTTMNNNLDKARVFIDQHPEITCTCVNHPGDANHDGSANVGDAIYIINYIFKGGPQPACMGEADANCDCALNVGDAVWMVNYVFKSGAPPIYCPMCW